MGTLLTLADAHHDWRPPGYTYLQRAQPVSLGHHLLAWFWMRWCRDADRFSAAAAWPRARCRSVPGRSLGSTGSSTGRRRPPSSASIALAENSIDAVSNRDFALDYLHAATVCSTHLSRMGSEIVLCRLASSASAWPAEEYSSGSSIMPQKMNPDAAELLRAKAPRVQSDHTNLAGVLHGLPLAYSKDLQEDKEPLFDAVDTVELSLRALAGMLEGISFDRERMEAAAGDEMAAATDIADLLVRRGMPFREAHGVVGGLVRHALANDIQLSGIGRDELAGFSELLDDEYYEVLAEGSWLDSKLSRGGTSSAAVSAQLELARESLAELAR